MNFLKKNDNTPTTVSRIFDLNYNYYFSTSFDSDFPSPRIKVLTSKVIFHKKISKLYYFFTKNCILRVPLLPMQILNL